MQLPQEPEIRQQLERIFASARFKDASRSRRFLEFIVDEALAGKGAELKENIVGINVFDRRPDYDPRLDAIVRVEAGRLRAKLLEYYSAEGNEDQVVFALPKGGYAPEFAWRVALQPEQPNSAMDCEISIPPEPYAEIRRAPVARYWIAIGLVAVIFSGLMLASVWLARQDAADNVRIAVLPFTLNSTDANDQVTATRLTEKVTAELVKLGKFNVVPSTSARQFADRRPGVREIATALHADILLEARIEAQGGNIKVEVRLSDGELDRKFWVRDQFVGENIDVLAERIAGAASHAVLNRRTALSQQ